MIERAALAVVCLACLGCITAAPTCLPGSVTAEADEAGFFVLAAVPAGEEKAVHLVVRATGDEPVQLLLNEWSMTTPSGTSSVAFGAAPHGDAMSASYPVLTLPPGAEWQERVFPRSSVVRPVVPIPGLRRILPLAAGHPCPYRCTVQLAYVVQAGDRKHIGVLTLPLAFDASEPPAPVPLVAGGSEDAS